MLFAVRSATALHRLLDVLPVFAGDPRVVRRFTLVPGSDFGVDALAAIERYGARTIPWTEAVARTHQLILASSPKGDLDRLRGGPLVLLPHGAGFNKVLAGDGSDDSASGLDRAYLERDGRLLAGLHALAHPSQVSRLRAECPEAARRAAVVGDPTLDRMLASLPHRDRYRSALGTGGRKLVVFTSTWGPESLLVRRPGLIADVVGELTYDGYQLALVAHPNVHSKRGLLDLQERLAPAVRAGLVLARPYEEWAALLVAADAVVTDHGSTALYAAALDLPILAACDGGDELIAGSPMAELLAHVPWLESPGDVERAISAHRAGSGRALASAAFAAGEQGRAVERLRGELYALLGMEPLSGPPDERALPAPIARATKPAAFAVRVRLSGGDVHVERRPPYGASSSHHLAAEHGRATAQQSQSAAVLFHSQQAGRRIGWTVSGWISATLAQCGGRRTAGVVLSEDRCVVRRGDGPLLSVHIADFRERGRVFRADPAAVLSAVHAWMGEHSGAVGAGFRCLVAGRAYTVRIATASPADAEREI
ncbi:translation initiation factor 2 [Streptomyces spiramyceticus]|uniref:translation initiation factor 2 n=1 Tax=Streptomyces spiramyceticus TaxID=299717 RepID=UPI00237BB934|nr:translation initiation factor 2 [Streptomyces spiramyceticus]